MPNGRVLESLGATIGRLHDLDPDRVGQLDPRPRSLSEYLVQRIEWDIGRRIYEDRLPGELAGRFWKSLPARRRGRLGVRHAGRVAQLRILLPAARGRPRGATWSGPALWRNWWTGKTFAWATQRRRLPLSSAKTSYPETGRARFWDGYARTRGSRAGPVGQRVATWEPVTMFGSAMWWLDRYCSKLRARRTGVPNAVVPRALSYYRKVAVSMLRRFESRYQEPS